MNPFFVYLLRCADGSYYAGHTDDLGKRVAAHEAGALGGYTAERRPVRLVWSQETATREEALAAEMRIKGWSRAQKEALIAGDWERVSRLARGVLRQARDERGKGHSRPTREDEAVRAAPSARTEPVEGPPATPPTPPTTTLPPLDAALRDGIHRSERRALAKAITLLESTRGDHRQRADALLDALLPDTGRSLRLGVSGVPGVGKSTFIESLGLMLIDRGHRVAVLAIDPSSSVSGGSILGDKTRMERLSVAPNAYIRPSPASGTLGGVAEKTREAMLVCEAAGHDVVIVETVGVGQSETAVASMTDLFVLMQLPNAGDDLQAIKKGVMELADLVVVNKADLDPHAATRAEATITSAMRLLRPAGDGAGVLSLSALQGQGVDAFWTQVEALAERRKTSGSFEARRRSQALSWMWDLIQARLQADFRQHPSVREALAGTLADVADARVAPSAAARRLLTLFRPA